MRFFVSVGRGLNPFVEENLQLICIGCPKIEAFDGKVRFEVDNDSIADIKQLLQLKCAERLFAEIAFSTEPKSQFAAKDFLEKIDLNAFRAAYETFLLFQTTNEAKRQKLEAVFRLNWKLTGKIGRSLKHMTSGTLHRTILGKLAANLEWKCNCRQFVFEIIIHVSDAYITVGIPVSHETLANRSYMKYPGLRSTICDAIVQLAKPEPNQLILDPMCGKGTLLIEYCRN